MPGTATVQEYPRINPDRLWSNLTDLGSIGKGKRGVTRLAFTGEDVEGRRWFARKLEEEGLEVRVDEVGNVFGRVPIENRGPNLRRPSILVGSHLDTVPEGGMFDGALGVVSALECVLILKEHGLLGEYPVEIVAFSNEEGSRGGAGLFGSRAFADGITQEEWETMRPFLEAAGFLRGHAPGVLPKPSLKPEEYVAYLELHIEQGGILDRSGEDIGVVQGIVGIHTFSVCFKGEANHAGTTPMDQRRDALCGACELVLAVPELVRAYGSPATAGTCGQMRVSPGGRNIIPGEAEVSLEVRDLDERIASRVVQACREKAREIASCRGLELSLSPVEQAPGALLDVGIQDIVWECARSLGLKSRRMPSGAGHDAAVLAKHLRTGMIFVPSVGGISHSPQEWTTKDACANGAQVLLLTIMRLHERRGEQLLRLPWSSPRLL